MDAGSGHGVRLGERRGLRSSERGLLSSVSWGLCSMVSCSKRLVSWMSRSICRDRESRLAGEGGRRSRPLVGKHQWEKGHLIKWDMPDWRAIDLQDPVAHMDGALQVRAHALWVQSAGEGKAHVTQDLLDL